MMGELKFFMGLQIKQFEDEIFINQEKYTKKMLKKFGVMNLKSIRTPIILSIKLDKHKKGKDVDQKHYKGMSGSFLYLIASRPNILFNVCVCARFQSCPKESHLTIVKTFICLMSISHT